MLNSAISHSNNNNKSTEQSNRILYEQKRFFFYYILIILCPSYVVQKHISFYHDVNFVSLCAPCNLSLLFFFVLIINCVTIVTFFLPFSLLFIFCLLFFSWKIPWGWIERSYQNRRILYI